METKILGYTDENQQTIEIRITKSKYPLLWERKVKELTQQGLSESDAERILGDWVVTLDLYYEIGSGLFAVETDAVESGSIHSPYSDSDIVPADLQDQIPSDAVII